MDCKKAEKLLVEYLYQELSPKHTVDLEKHLEVCDVCSHTLENWRAIHRGYQKTNEEPPTVPYLKQRILTAAKEELQRKPSFSERFFLILKPALILPVILFGLIATLMLYTNQGMKMAQAPERAIVDQPSARQSSVDLDKTTDLKRKEYSGSKAERERNERADLQPEKETSEKLRGLGYVGEGQSSEADQFADDENNRSKDAPKKAGEYEQGAPISQPEEQRKEVLNKESGEVAGAVAPAAPAAMRPPAEAKKIASTEPQPSFEEAQLYFRSNNLPQGKVVAEQAIQNDKNQGRADLALQFHEAGRRYQASKEPEQAIVQYNLVLNNYPEYTDSPDVLLRLAESYEQIGQYDQALKAYQQLARYPKMKGTADQRIGDMQKKQKTRDQLRSLGYTDPEKKQ